MKLAFQLAFAQTLSLWRAGALNVLVFSLVLAITAITAVGFFTQRVESALNQQGGLLLGGDVAILSDHEIADNFVSNAHQQAIQTAKTYEFASMVSLGEKSQLAEIKAVSNEFPLRGDLTISNATTKQEKTVKAGPPKGEVWLEPRLSTLIQANVGDVVQLGVLRFKVSAILTREASRGGDMFNFAPRLMMNAADLTATQLIQKGSRVKYQLLLAGTPQKINAFMAFAKPLLGRGEKMQDVRNARPEIKSALEKAQQFLGLSAMVSVILAMVAMVLSSQPYIKQSLDTFALMRCFGASKKSVMQILAFQTLLIAAVSAMLGILFGFIAQLGLEQIAGRLFVETLPPVSWQPALVSVLVSLVMMFAVVFPHAWQLRKMSAMNILRRETLQASFASQIKFLPALLVMIVAIFWQAQDFKLAMAMSIALILIGLVMMVFAYGFIQLSERFLAVVPKNKTLNTVQLGIAGVNRRFGLSVMQMIGFSIGLMVLMLLALVRNDLINNWQASLPANAPNRFLINIQESERADIQQFFQMQNIQEAKIFPMVRGRLVSKNGAPMQQKRWHDDEFENERAKRLAEREFNLSVADVMQSDNQLVAGRWWRDDERSKPYLSLEKGLAKTLGIKMGDKLVFDVAGTQLTLTVLSLRKVDWDTMRANFFAVTPSPILAEFSASFISSFHLPADAENALNQLVQTMPNLTVIDIAALLEQVRGIMQQMSSTIEVVFLLSLLAGLAVLYAALIATQEERIKEATLMRVFGASKRDVSFAYITEFVCIAMIAALVASVAAHALAYYLSQFILNIPFKFNFLIAALSVIFSTLLIPLAAWFGLRKTLNLPPRQLLQSI